MRVVSKQFVDDGDVTEVFEDHRQEQIDLFTMGKIINFSYLIVNILYSACLALCRILKCKRIPILAFSTANKQA